MSVEIRNNETGETRYFMEDEDTYESEDSIYFAWADGNYSCDCNRAIAFARAGGDEYGNLIANPQCGSGKYTVPRIKLMNGTVIHVDVDLTAYELALVFSRMSSNKRAEFFNSLADIISNWSPQLTFQLESLIDSRSLTRGGKEIMRMIGKYGSEDTQND